MLEVKDLHAYYGKSHILQGVDLHIAAGEVVSLLGRNGVGRSTTVKAIMGEVAPHGTIRFKGRTSPACRATGSPASGWAMCPSTAISSRASRCGRTCCSASRISAVPANGGSRTCWRCFPNLAARADTAAGVLSGGEKQMLTTCRTLMGDPELIMIDEPTEGLAPLIVQQVGDLIARIARSRRCDPAGRAKAVDRAADLASGLRHGSWPDRVRGHARSTQGQ